jgi:hypothetical protein
MQKIPNNSYPVPRSLKQHMLWLSASLEWRAVYDWLMHHAVYNEEFPFDINGRTIYLKKGQCAFTIRQIAKDLKITKAIVEGAIKHFKGVDRRNKLRFMVASGQLQALLGQQVGQQFRHEKTILDILCDGYFENTQTTKQTTNQTVIRTTVGQQSDTNKKDKKEKEGASEEFVKEQQPPNPQQTKKTKTTTAVAVSLEQLDIPLSDKNWIATYYPDEAIVNEAIKFVTTPPFVVKKTLAAALKWALIAHPWKNQAVKLSNFQLVAKHFQHGKIYKGAECFLNETSIAFQRGMNHRQLKFSESGFFEQFDSMLRNFDIPNPFNKIEAINTK